MRPNAQEQAATDLADLRSQAKRLAAELRGDPGAAAGYPEPVRSMAEAWLAYQQAAAPLLEALAAAGFHLETIRELRDNLQRGGQRYEPAVPILLRSLPEITYRPLAAEVVDALAVPWAKRQAAPALIHRFRTLSPHQGAAQDPRWEVGNALEVLTHPAIADDLLELVQDRRYGYARQPLVLGLARLKRDARVVPTLIRLLDDPEVAGFAIAALGRLKAHEAREPLERFLDHPEAEFRTEARRALHKLDR